MASESGIPPSTLAAVVKKLQGIKELAPTVSKNGKVTYSALEEFNIEDQEGVLRSMLESGYLVESTSETLLTCPKCHRSSLVPILKCPRCKSSLIRKQRLIEHRIGGHIHPESAFRRKEGLVCPSCGKALTSESEYRTLAGWFECGSCGEKSAQIAPEFRCLEDGVSFAAVNAELKYVTGYNLTEKAMHLFELDKGALLELVVSLIPAMMTVTKGVSMQGKSGATHIFDVTVSSNGTQRMIDIVFSKTPVDDTVLLASYAKVFDTGSQNYVLIAWPGLSPSSKNLANLYKIQTIEASSSEELRSRIETLLKSVKG